MFVRVREKTRRQGGHKSEKEHGRRRVREYGEAFTGGNYTFGCRGSDFYRFSVSLYRWLVGGWLCGSVEYICRQRRYSCLRTNISCWLYLRALILHSHCDMIRTMVSFCIFQFFEISRFLCSKKPRPHEVFRLFLG